MSLNLKRGAYRVWWVGTIAWLFGSLISNGPEIAEFVGYWTGGISRSGSLAVARAEHKRTEILIDACREAFDTSCIQTSRAENYSDWECRDPEGLLRKLRMAAASRGFRDADKIAHPKACDYFYMMEIPRFRWVRIVSVLLVPALPLLVFFVGRWVVRGFEK